MAYTEFSFTPSDGFENKTSFPSPGSEDNTREQLQRIPSQIRDYINSLLTKEGTNVVKLRISTDNVLQYSYNGEDWRTCASTGEIEYKDESYIPLGGTKGQHLIKKSDGDRDLVFADFNIDSEIKESSNPVTNATLKAKFDSIDTQLSGKSFRVCSQAEYDAMSSHDANTIYFIEES